MRRENAEVTLVCLKDDFYQCCQLAAEVPFSNNSWLVMRLLRRFAYVWKFNDGREEAYREFTLPINSISLQVINILIIIGMLAFVIVDIFRHVNYSFVLMSRLSLACIALGVMLFSWNKKSTPTQVDWSLMLSLVSLATFAFITVWFGDMPFFFLPNISITIMVFVATISGLRLRYALLFNFLYLTLYIFYSQAIHREPFLLSQTPNLVSMFVYSTIAGVLIEIRRRKNFLQYEDLLRQKKRIEQLNLQKNKIISLLSHDVASPLNSLSGLLRLQLDDQVADYEIKPFLKQMSHRLNDVSSLLYGLVRWSRSQLDGFVVDKKEIEVVGVMNEIVELFRPLAAEKSLDLKLSSPAQYVARVDEEMIRVAFRNLISNAIKFALKGSIININFVEDHMHGVTVKVANTGSAVPDDVQEKLFRVHVTSTHGTDGEKGTGLGLVMAAQFVRMNDGQIYLEKSVPAGQTIFCIALPLS